MATPVIDSTQPPSSRSARRQGRRPKAGPITRISSAAPSAAGQPWTRYSVASLRDGLERERLDQRAGQRPVARHAAPVAELDRHRADQDRFACDRGRVEPAIENVDVAQLRDRGRVDAEVDQHLAGRRGRRPGQPRGHRRHGPVGERRDGLDGPHAPFGVGLDVDRRPAGETVEAVARVRYRKSGCAPTGGGPQGRRGLARRCASASASARSSSSVCAELKSKSKAMRRASAATRRCSTAAW